MTAKSPEATPKQKKTLTKEISEKVNKSNSLAFTLLLPLSQTGHNPSTTTTSTALLTMLVQSRKEESAKVQTQIAIVENEIETKKLDLKNVEAKIEQRKVILNDLIKNLKNKRKELSHFEPATIELLKQYKIYDKQIIDCQNFARKYLSRRRLQLFHSELVYNYVKHSDTKSARLRNKALHEILESERSYVGSLDKFWQNYVIPLKSKHLLKDSDFDSIFADMEVILDLSRILLEKLEKRLELWPRVLFGDIFLDAAPVMKLYYRYIRNYNKNRDLLLENAKKNPEFSQFNNTQEALFGAQVASFLILPVQRLPRYEMLLQALIKVTPTEHVDYQNLCEAHDAVVTVNLYIERRHDLDIQKELLLKALTEQRAKIKSSSRKDLRKVSTIGYLMVRIGKAKLPSASDSSVRLHFGKNIFETEVIKKTTDPDWKKDFVLELQEAGPEKFCIQILVEKKKQLKTKTLSELEFSVKDFFVNHNVSSTFPMLSLKKKEEKSNKENPIQIHLRFNYYAV